jgi:hypothetical protein
MSTCKNCKCDSKNCGCADKAIPTAPPCGQGTADCPDPEPCAETFSAQCLIYLGDSLPQLGITQGDRMQDIIQRLGLWILSAGCIDPTASCQAVTNLYSTSISTSIVKLAWNASPSAISYTVQYSLDNITWFSYTPNITATTYTIGGLTTATDYYFRILTNCAVGGPCTSLVIQLTTL